MQLPPHITLPQLPLWRWLLAEQAVQLPAAPDVQVAQFVGQSTQVPLMPTVQAGHVLPSLTEITCWHFIQVYGFWEVYLSPSLMFEHPDHTLEMLMPQPRRYAAGRAARAA